MSSTEVPPTKIKLSLPAPTISFSEHRKPVVAPIGSSLVATCTSNITNPVITWHTAEDLGELSEGVSVSTTSSNASVLSISTITSEHYITFVCSVRTAYLHCGPDPTTSAFKIFPQGVSLVMMYKNKHFRYTCVFPKCVFVVIRFSFIHLVQVSIEVHTCGKDTSLLHFDVLINNL